MPDHAVIVEDVHYYYSKIVVDTGGLWRRIASLAARRRERVRALAGVSFRLAGGEGLAILGPNGAGKSTLLKIVLGIIPPAQGRVEVFGLDPYRRRREAAKLYGVVFGSRDLLWWHVPVIDSLRLLRRAYSVSEGDFEWSLERYGRVLCPGDLLYRPPQRMSLGQRRRCELLAALIHRPRLLVLDEPFLGLDVFVREELRRIVELYHEEGGSVLLATHELGEIPGGYRVLVLDRGRPVYYGGIDELRDLVRPVRVLVVVSRGERLEGVPWDVVLEYGVEERRQGYVHRLVVPRDKVGVVLSSLDYDGIVDVRVSPPGLDEVIRGLIGRGVAGG